MDRPLWQIVLSILLLSFAVQRAGAAAIAWGGAAPHEWALATGFEAAAAAAAAVCLWIGGRPAAVGIVVLGVAMAASAAMLVVVYGAPAAPAALSRILVAAIGAGGFCWIFRRELSERAHEPPRSNRPQASRDL